MFYKYPKRTHYPRISPARHPEAFLQEQFVRWLDNRGLLFTAFMTGNIKISAFAAMMKKRLGVRAGVPDILIFEPAGKYHGLFLELKAPQGDTDNPKQLWWQAELTKRGYLSLIMPKGLEFPQSLYYLQEQVEKYLEG